MRRTQEQIDADSGLREAVQRVCAARGWLDGADLNEFVLSGVATEREQRQDVAHHRYFLVLSDDALPEHHVVGLLRQGMHFYDQLSARTELE